MEKTIKEIADELGVSKDKIRYQVRKLPSNYIVKKNGITYLKDGAIKAIRESVYVNSIGNSIGDSAVFTHPFTHPENTLINDACELLTT